jgi:hypothetical protein
MVSVCGVAWVALHTVVAQLHKSFVSLSALAFVLTLPLLDDGDQGKLRSYSPRQLYLRNLKTL